MISARPVTAASGMPPAIPLAVVMRSGTMPKRSLANIAPVRAKPVWISSAMKTTPFARHQSTSALRKPSAGTMKPPSPWIGSMMTAARLSAPTCFSMAVIAVVEGDAGPLLRELAGDLERVLDSLGAGVEQCALLLVVARGHAVEGLGDAHVRLVRRDHEARVRELGRLRLDRLDDLRVRVAERRHGDAGAEVDEGVAVRVDDDAAAGSYGLDRDGVPDTGRDGRGLAGEQLLRTGPGDARDETALLRERGSAERLCGD